LLDHVAENSKKAKKVCEKMLELDIIQSVEGKKSFSMNDIYRLYMDRDDIADNIVRKWKGEARNALDVSV
jgi:hypothetical protein